MKKNIEHCNSVDAGAHKVGKVVSFWPNFDPNSPDTVFGKYEKGKLHILKKVGLAHLGRYYKNVYITALLCFLMYFYFAWKSTQRP